VGLTPTRRSFILLFSTPARRRSASPQNRSGARSRNRVGYAIGAFSRAVLGYFQWKTKRYKKIAVGEQVEVLSLLDDVAVGDQGPTLQPCVPRDAPVGRSSG
jgi:hypothetical protein